jgi:hypothetical protein
LRPVVSRSNAALDFVFHVMTHTVSTGTDIPGRGSPSP